MCPGNNWSCDVNVIIRINTDICGYGFVVRIGNLLSVHIHTANNCYITGGGDRNNFMVTTFDG